MSILLIIAYHPGERLSIVLDVQSSINALLSFESLAAL